MLEKVQKPNQVIKGKNTMKLKSIIEITLILFLIVSIFAANITFSKIIDLDHKWILWMQKYLYKFASNPIYDTITTQVCDWIFKSNSLNSLLAFIFFAYSPFLAFKCILIFNIGTVITEFLNITIYRQVRPYWIYLDLKTIHCSETLSGLSELLYSSILVSLTFSFNFSKLKILNSGLNYFIVGFGLFIGFLHAINYYITARLFFTQIFSAVVWGLISFILVKMWDDRINIISFKLGFFLRKSKKRKIFALCYIILLYFFMLLLVTGMDYNTLIDPEYVMNFFDRCFFDPYFINTCLINTHDAISYIFAIPLIAFGSNFIYYNYHYHWEETPLYKRLIRGVIAYIVMTLILRLKVVTIGILDSLISVMVLSGILPIIVAYLVCYYILPIIFYRMNLFNTSNSIPLENISQIVNKEEKEEKIIIDN